MMRLRLVTILVAVVLAATAIVFAGVTANPVNGFPSRAQACTNCHNAAPASATVSASPSTSTPAAGATYSVAINLAGLTASGDTGYWITNSAGTPAVSVFGGDTGTNQTTYTQTMTAPSTAGTYSYTVWCDRGGTGSGVAKSTTYTITVPAPPVPAAAITSLSPNHGPTATSVVVAGSNLGSGGTVRFGATTATTTAWSATQVTATVPAGLAPGAATVTVTPTGAAASNGLVYTVDAPPAPVAGVDTVAPTTRALGPCQVRRYQTARLRFQVNDPAPSGGTAAVVITIKNRRGAIVKVLKLGSRPVNTPLDATFKCSLRLGTYRFYVQATDTAGHRQANIASQKLTVYRASSKHEDD